MRPEDDNSWPLCVAHSVRHWCPSTAQFLREGKDAPDLRHEMRCCVPVVPDFNLYAEVSIGIEVIPDRSYEFALVVVKDDFSMEEELVPLGLWMRGEGRLVMASVVNDWADGYADPTCNSTSHGFTEEVSLQTHIQQGDPMFIKANRWSMAYYKKCFPCQQTVIKSGLTTSLDKMTADVFGLNQNDFRGQGGNSAPSNSRQNRAREALQARFGS